MTLTEVIAVVILALLFSCTTTDEVHADRADAQVGTSGQVVSASRPGSADITYLYDYKVVEDSLATVYGCYVAQGTGVGRTHVYTIKRNRHDSVATIHRTDQASGATKLMHNGSNGRNYATSLGHGNDMALLSLNHKMFMYIATMSLDGRLVKLRYSGSGTYYAGARYTVKVGRRSQPVSGVKVLSWSSTTVKLLFMWDNEFFRGYVAADAPSGTVIQAHRAFTVDTSRIKINGKVADYSSSDWRLQGIGYDKASDSVFYPMTRANVSIVAVYRDASTATDTVVNDPGLSYRITSSTWSNLFEIESVGKGGNGRLWFSANRRKVATDTMNNMVGYFR